MCTSLPQARTSLGCGKWHAIAEAAAVYDPASSAVNYCHHGLLRLPYCTACRSSSMITMHVDTKDASWANYSATRRHERGQWAAVGWKRKRWLLASSGVQWKKAHLSARTCPLLHAALHCPTRFSGLRAPSTPPGFHGKSQPPGRLTSEILCGDRRTSAGCGRNRRHLVRSVSQFSRCGNQLQEFWSMPDSLYSPQHF